MEYQQNIFYNTKTLSKNQFKKLMEEAQTLCYNWWVDDKPTWTRRQIDMPFDRVMNLFFKTTHKNLHLTVIHRMSICLAEKEHLEIGFCTIGRSRTNKNGDIFLWIEVDLEHKDYLLEKYKLNEIL